MSSDEYDGERSRRRRRQSSGGSRRYHGQRPREKYDVADGDRRQSDRRPEISLRTLLVSLAFLAALIVVGGSVWFYYTSFVSPEARALAQAHSQPLVGMVIADQPGIEKQLRAAVEQDLRQPTKEGLSREKALIAELRSAYIAPVLRRADDASLLAAMAARAAFIDHLNRTDTRMCREFALGNLEHPDKLDADGQLLYKAVLAAIELAYRSGRAANQPPPMPNLRQVGNMLAEAGFTKPDFDKLNSFSTLSNDVTCYIMLKLNQAPANLKPDERGPFARYILGN